MIQIDGVLLEVVSDMVFFPSLLLGSGSLTIY